MSDGDAIVREFEGYTPNPTLRSLVGRDTPPLREESYRTEAEDAATACLPGDDVTSHPLHSEINPYLFRPHSVLREALEDGYLSAREERLVRQAIDMQVLQHGDGRPMGIRRPGDDVEREPDPSRSPLQRSEPW